MARWLLPGRLANRDNWVAQQKAFAYAGIAIAFIVYGLVLVKILA
jgi:hypothetical protein